MLSGVDKSLELTSLSFGVLVGFLTDVGVGEIVIDNLRKVFEFLFCELPI